MVVSACQVQPFPGCEAVRCHHRLVAPGMLPVLWPLLTPVLARRSLLAATPAVADGLGLQASLSKDVNSHCTAGPFISGAEHRAALCRASSLRQPYMVFLFVGSSALTGGFLPTEPRGSAVASI